MYLVIILAIQTDSLSRPLFCLYLW